MTSWVTFETINETAQRSEFAVRSFYVDRLGCHQYHDDDRVRFEFKTVNGVTWSVVDREREDDNTTITTYDTIGTMRECVQWIAARVLYGA